MSWDVYICDDDGDTLFLPDGVRQPRGGTYAMRRPCEKLEKATEGNARQALQQLLEMGRALPNGVWSVW